MNKIKTSLIVLVALFVSGVAMAQNTETELYKFLKSSQDVKSVTPIEKGEFKEKYVVEISQPLDYKTATEDRFNQRFVVAHVDRDSVNVMITEGYVGDYALNPRYREEISKKMNGNMIFVEHRYFSGSTPEPLDWQYFNGYNAANDLHRINQLMKKFYGEQRWVATGISKGGQNSMIYRTYFPEDVQATVPYVGPICFGVEDGRHEPFLNKAGREIDRERKFNFQREILTRRAEMEKMLDEYSKEKGYEYLVGIDSILDFCVLEFPFATWQWGTPTELIPSPNSDSKVLFDYLMQTSSPDYYVKSATTPFFVQAAKELGYYGYDTKPLKDLLKVKSTKGYLSKMFLGEDYEQFKFDKTLSRDMDKFLTENDPTMLFVYGEWDPWSAVKPSDKYLKGKKNMFMMIEAEGSHSTRIGTLSRNQQRTAWRLLNEWLKRK